MLLWGTPIPTGDVNGKKTYSSLLSASVKLGELPNRRTEPDVILDFGSAGIVMIEVKHRSPNSISPIDYANWPRYLKDTQLFHSPDEVRKIGLYELARNWRVTSEMARESPMALVNLGPATLFLGSKGKAVEALAKVLNQNEHRKFIPTTWTQFLGSFEQPDWLRTYLTKRSIQTLQRAAKIV